MKKNKTGTTTAVIDTNVFVSGLISKKGPPHQIISLLKKDYFNLIISLSMRRELEEVLRRIKFSAFLSEDKISKFLFMIDTISLVVSKIANSPIETRDSKDEHVLDAAFRGKADYLVTGDKDLLDLKDNPKLGNLKIVTVQEFLKAILIQSPSTG